MNTHLIILAEFHIYILYDNMKTVIVERDCYGEGKHRLQSGFWDFSKHYGFIPKVCRPYRAQTKGKVERFIHFLKYSFYYPLIGELRSSGLIVDEATANFKVLHWLNEVANQRCHGTTGEIPFVRLQEEQGHLQTVPVSYLGALSQKEPQKAKNNIETMDFSIQHRLDIYDALLQEGVAV